MNEKIEPDFNIEESEEPGSREDQINKIFELAENYEDFMSQLNKEFGHEFSQMYGQSLWKGRKKE